MCVTLVFMLLVQDTSSSPDLAFIHLCGVGVNILSDVHNKKIIYSCQKARKHHERNDKHSP